MNKLGDNLRSDWVTEHIINTVQARVYKTCFHTPLKFFMLINVKMPTFVGILTFISILNTFESLEASKDFIFQHLSFYEQLKFRAQLS